jgi:serine/threonine protein phosphatase 1
MSSDGSMNLPTQISGPVAVIGDVHGQLEKLDRLLEKLFQTPGALRRTIAFAGDLVDRGPDPRGVLERFLQLRRVHKRTTAVAGNHDYAMAAALKLVPTPTACDWRDRWLSHYDAQTTFASYGVEFGDLSRLAHTMPQAQKDLLAGLPWMAEHEDFLLVHAGLSNRMPLDTQLAVLRERDFTLHRPEWLCERELAFEDPPEECERAVISGHVYVERVEFRDRRILCDTTAGVAGELSAVLLPERRVLTSSPDLDWEQEWESSAPRERGFFGRLLAGKRS